MDTGNNKVEPIYALMITGKDDMHFNLAQKSVQSFLAQTYENKKLIIINDGNYRLKHVYDDDCIHEAIVERKYSLGQLRNISLEMVPDNAIWMQWDDDDWHHPNCMKAQYEYMKKYNFKICAMRNQVVYDFVNNRSWIDTTSELGHQGMLMNYKDHNITYPNLNKAEDTDFYLDILKHYKCGKETVFDNPDYLYIKFIHGNNAWDSKFWNKTRLRNKRYKKSKQGQEYLIEILKLYNTDKS